MSAAQPAFKTRPFPLTRNLVVDAGAWNRRKHNIHLLGEFDVTEARLRIRAEKARTGETLSFTAFIAACVGRTVAFDRSWHAYRKGRRLILFDDVDIAILVERPVEGAKLATFYVVRRANAKTVRDIHDEIRKAQQETIEAQAHAGLWKVYLALPAFVRRLLYRWIERSPETQKRLGGTVVITSIGMFGKGGGWGIPIPTATLGITVGGVSEKPAVVDGKIVPREMLDLTISFNHDVVDGAPAARFAAKLREIVESAALLE